MRHDRTMVIVLGNHAYTLTYLPDHSRLLTIGKKYYRWDTAPDGQEQLTRIRPQKVRSPDYRGNCWMFNVVENPRYTPGVHLSLVLKPGEWAAYMLSSRLPDTFGESCTIEPTDERIAWPRTRTMVI